MRQLKQAGVSLIELIAGIVVLAIALSVITSVIGPLFIKSADPWHQVRATELGHSIMNEILALSFDENSDRSGGMLRCNEPLPGALPCTAELNFGIDGAEQRDSFNDVDDFHLFSGTGESFSNIMNSELADKYRQYKLRVSVRYITAADLSSNPALGLGTQQAKLITVFVTTPTDTELAFSAIKANW